MKKVNVLWTILYLIFLIVFNLIFYMLGGTVHPASVWISYFFIHFAYIMMVCTPFLVKKGREAAVFGFALSSISAVYFLVEFIVGVIFIIMAPEGFKAALIVQVIIAAVYAVALLSNMIANEYTGAAVERHEAELQYVKESSTRLKAVMQEIKGGRTAKKVERAYDLIHSSPVKTDRRVAEIEYAVFEELGRLERAAAQNDENAVGESADKLVKLANERNRQLKLQQ